ncbi:glutamyl-tRNA reductase [Deinococcus ruber]|uniref:Glutamyl-tRNA reductase n=1 Tax=Deinococcus ruber TaxID=1848197 RepID=A0A918C8F0_9DEIO|nr:glutamyl-tRNA reductase [Deinococcus ruber]
MTAAVQHLPAFTGTCPTALRLRPEQSTVHALDLAVVGLNHKTAPLNVRERAAVRDGEQEALLRHLRQHAHEVMLLSTCNRTEVYMAGVQGDPLSAFEGAWGHALRQHLYVHQGVQAADHLYRVAAGLDSLVLGETQIQGQVKRAWQDAQQRGDTAALLNKAAQGALATGKRVRHETGLNDNVVSVSSAAVELARGIFGSLEGRTALIVGAGETAELTLTHLRAAGVKDVIVVNRTEERARLLAEKVGGRACASEMLHTLLPEADVVIASSSAPHYVLKPQGVQDALRGRAAPMFLIDISVPRILDPAIADVPGAHLYNLDDLEDIVQSNLSTRVSLLPQAQEILGEGVADLKRWNAFREAR